MEAANAPNWIPGKPTRSKYPREYRNDEGSNQRYALYESWEHKSPSQLKSEGHSKPDQSQRIPVNGGYPTGGFLKPAKNQVHQEPASMLEYPVSTKPAGHTPFDYHKRPARANQVERPITNGERKNLATKPLNDPGTFRANTNIHTGHVVGATYHPEGNKEGFVRATMSPLDRQAGRNMRQHQDMASRPEIRRRDAAQRGEAWDNNHPGAKYRTMTMPGREQSSEVMTEAINGYTGGRRPNKWSQGKLEVETRRER